MTALPHAAAHTTDRDHSGHGPTGRAQKGHDVHFTILTLFPEFFDSPLSTALMGKAREQGLVSFSFVNPREFTKDRHRTVDDRPYGGGPGMVMLLDPLVSALESVQTVQTGQIGQTGQPGQPYQPGRPDHLGRTLMLSPRGRPLDQALARELASEERVTLICGRYEGIDARLAGLFPMEEVSVGDYVLSGGEAGALCLMEAVARLLPGFMGHEGSGEEESFSAGLLEYPHYTRPEEYRGLRVPEILLSGDHARVAAWRRQKSLEATLAQRPEMLARTRLDAADLHHLREVPRQRLGRGLYLALAHYPVLDKAGNITSVSLTNLDVHDICRVSRTYGAAGLYLVTPLEDQRELAEALLGHWVGGPGGKANPDRQEALRLARVSESLEDAVADIQARTGCRPRLVATSAALPGAKGRGKSRLKGKQRGDVRQLIEADVREWLAQGPVLLVFGTSHGLANEVLQTADGVLQPIRGLDDYNHLPVRAAAAICLDRLLADHW